MWFYLYLGSCYCPYFAHEEMGQKGHKRQSHTDKRQDQVAPELSNTGHGEERTCKLSCFMIKTKEKSLVEVLSSKLSKSINTLEVISFSSLSIIKTRT